MVHRSVHGVARIAASFLASLAIYLVMMTFLWGPESRGNAKLGWLASSATWMVMAMPGYVILGTPFWVVGYIVLELVARSRGRKADGDDAMEPRPPFEKPLVDPELPEAGPTPVPERSWWRIARLVVGLGLAGLLATPIAVSVLGMLLPNYTPSAQGTGTVLFFMGVATALPAAVYGMLVAISWTTRSPKADDDWFWTAAGAAYAAAVLALIALVGLSFG